jgi:predicted RNA-binding protein YlxR (DUF448 family)
MTHKHKTVPQRMCVVCRSKDNKRRLTRLVRTADGVVIDPTGKQNGRGAYLCDNPACHERAAISDILAKALRTELTDLDRQRIREVAAAS